MRKPEPNWLKRAGEQIDADQAAWRDRQAAAEQVLRSIRPDQRSPAARLLVGDKTYLAVVPEAVRGEHSDDRAAPAPES